VTRVNGHGPPQAAGPPVEPVTDPANLRVAPVPTHYVLGIAPQVGDEPHGIITFRSPDVTYTVMGTREWLDGLIANLTGLRDQLSPLAAPQVAPRLIVPGSGS
jgi:hypothetical protein